MKRILTCMKFEFSRIGRGCAILTVLYFSVLFAVMALMSWAEPDAKGTTNANLLFGAIPFLFFFLSNIYKNFYNNLLLFGNTRGTILASLFATGTALSAGFAALCVLSDAFNRLIGKILHADTSVFLKFIYTDSNTGSQLLWYFAMLLFFVAFAFLFGTLLYKFGKPFMIAFWVVFGLAWTIIPPILVAFHLTARLENGFHWFMGWNAQNGILLASFHLVVAALILGAIAYLIARRQPEIADD